MDSDTLQTSPAETNQAWLLVVDDEAPIGRFIVDAFAEEKIEVIHAHDGASALRELDKRSTEPLLALVDVMMPGMDGFTLARKLGSRLKRTKVAIISGHITDLSWWPVDLRETVFLAKPFRLADLIELLRTARDEYHQKN